MMKVCAICQGTGIDSSINSGASGLANLCRRCRGEGFFDEAVVEMTVGELYEKEEAVRHEIQQLAWKQTLLLRQVAGLTACSRRARPVYLRAVSEFTFTLIGVSATRKSVTILLDAIDVLRQPPGGSPPLSLKVSGDFTEEGTPPAYAINAKYAVVTGADVLEAVRRFCAQTIELEEEEEEDV